MASSVGIICASPRLSASGCQSRRRQGPILRTTRHDVPRTPRTRDVVRMRAAEESGPKEGEEPPKGSASGKKILVLGGTGKVGASTARSLISSESGVEVVLAGRSQSSMAAVRERVPELASCDFVECDAGDVSQVASITKGVDLVIHCAGPFQRKQRATVLEGCIEAGTPYMDVCDDSAYSNVAKSLHEKAKEKGVPCITSGGIYPGVSNLLAAEMLGSARKTSDGGAAVDAKPSKLLFSYFTAGTGGAGPTILETSLLLAGEPVTVYIDGSKKEFPPVSTPRVVDFGPGVGRKTLYLYNLPEIESCHRNLGVPSVSARFGTAPDVWNWGMVIAARLLPRSMLSDPATVKGLAGALGPLVRAVDGAVGEQVAMRVDLEFADGKVAVALWIHNKLSESVGHCTAAMALEMARGGTEPGVWFPEEEGAIRPGRRRPVLREAAKGCSRVLLNKAPWMIEQDPKWLGMGMYW